jgi:class 3 adenylate cyclase
MRRPTRQGAVPADRVLATVLFTDIVGSTEKAAELGDRRWRYLIDNHHDRLHGQAVRTMAMKRLFTA